jgi:hypothetical protein
MIVAEFYILQGLLSVTIFILSCLDKCLTLKVRTPSTLRFQHLDGNCRSVQYRSNTLREFLLETNGGRIPKTKLLFPQLTFESLKCIGHIDIVAYAECRFCYTSPASLSSSVTVVSAYSIELKVSRWPLSKRGIGMPGRWRI